MNIHSLNNSTIELSNDLKCTKNFIVENNGEEKLKYDSKDDKIKLNSAEIKMYTNGSDKTFE